jgi:hypothetical protein
MGTGLFNPVLSAFHPKRETDMKDKTTDAIVDFFDLVREGTSVTGSTVRPMNRDAAGAVAGAFFQNTCIGYHPGGGGDS